VVVVVVWCGFLTDNNTTLGLFCIALGCGNFCETSKTHFLCQDCYLLIGNLPGIHKQSHVLQIMGL
jgi:hypothetical protein